MEKIVRIATVKEQDAFRRDDMLKLTPKERIEALIEMRDHTYPYKPLERIISIRSLH